MKGLSPYHCLASCIKAGDDCAAFNLDRSAGVCELLSAHVCNHSGLELDRSDTFTYYDVYPESFIEVLRLRLLHLLCFVSNNLAPILF